MIMSRTLLDRNWSVTATTTPNNAAGCSVPLVPSYWWIVLCLERTEFPATTRYSIAPLLCLSNAKISFVPAEGLDTLGGNRTCIILSFSLVRVCL